MDKSWQGIHFCLNGTAYDAESPMDFITVGGVVAGDIEVGYGPARLFKSEIVNAIHAHLSEISEAGISANYNPQKMDKLDIYPNIWERDGDEGLEYITAYFSNLKNFVANCAKNNLGMAIYLC
ncbi:YfbM family protein [Microbulbifer taiwanensis]|uniref:YfbM family protein n=1 Tax=Microbulbifer taiwanensis TaxID=986746 RepID=UPI003605B385